ncbi:MAG TPA: iron-containing alcohol dehydrogenase [Anaerolineales bacterium]|nr:iron-containing alcohol dehydrogenase [Anaerolineales bacterium]
MTTSFAAFEFSIADQIVFGPGSLAQAAEALPKLGGRALLVTGRSGERADRLGALLEPAGVFISRFAVDGEPTFDGVREGLRQARQAQVDAVIGLGGGSALDAAKAIAILFVQKGDPLDYVEVIGRGMPLEGPGLPLIAIPTTAGTGTETTRNAVLASPEHGMKVSLRSPWLLPRLAIVDPELTYDAPSEIKARCGFDALAQLVEPYLSLRAQPMTDLLCREGMQRVAASLRRVVNGGDDPEAHADMSLAALLSGMALANAGLGIVHGLASAIGGLFPAPHGAICARLLAPALSENLVAMRARTPQHPALDRMADVGELLGGNRRAETATEWTQEAVEACNVPRLSRYGLTEAALPQVTQGALKASSTRANPIPLTEDEMARIVRAAL